MDDREWAMFSMEVEETFAGEFDEAREAVLRKYAGGLTAEAAGAALTVLVEGGQRFTPTPSEFVAAARSLDAAPVPPWQEVYREVVRCCYERTPEAAARRADALHPIFGAFVRSYGHDQLRLLRLNDPDYGGLERERLRSVWNEHVDASQARLAQGRALEATGRATRGALRRLDPLGALGMAPAAPELPSGGAA